MSKNRPTDLIKNLQPGEIDASGNKVLHILSKGNEYCIYEIEHNDINYQLRVAIDGYTDDSEKILTERFNIVKNKYIVAKGLLYRSHNFGMMKNRVAHTLATCLQNDKLKGDEFDELINEIKNEQKKLTQNRSFYYLPSLVLTTITAILAIYLKELRITDYQYWQILIIILGSLMGNSISLLTNIYKINFEERTQLWFYALMGIERIFLSGIASGIAYFLIRSKFIFPQIEIEDYWKIGIIAILASFSEKLIPNLLGKLERNYSE